MSKRSNTLDKGKGAAAAAAAGVSSQPGPPGRNAVAMDVDIRKLTVRIKQFLFTYLFIDKLFNHPLLRSVYFCPLKF